MRRIASLLSSLAPLCALLAACQTGAAPPADEDAPAVTTAPGAPAARMIVAPAVHATARAAFAGLLRDSAREGVRLAGMPAPEEAAAADLGAPLPVAMVRLDRLKEAGPGATLGALVERLDLVIYPVQVGAEVRAELEMAAVSGTWQAVSIGGAGHARAAFALRERLGAGAFLLRVPALGVELLARGEGEALELTPLYAVPAAGLKAGAALPAAEVLRRLQPLAKAHNGGLS